MTRRMRGASDAREIGREDADGDATRRDARVRRGGARAREICARVIRRARDAARRSSRRGAPRARRVDAPRRWFVDFFRSRARRGAKARRRGERGDVDERSD